MADDALIQQLLARIESILPQPLSAPDWNASPAWRYRKRSSGHGALEAHQQNMLVDVSKGWPTEVVYRDSQGFYLSERHRPTLTPVTQRR